LITSLRRLLSRYIPGFSDISDAKRGRPPLQQSIRCVHHSRSGAERDVDIGSEIHYTSNEVCVCVCVCVRCVQSRPFITKLQHKRGTPTCGRRARWSLSRRPIAIDPKDPRRRRRSPQGRRHRPHAGDLPRPGRPPRQRRRISTAVPVPRTTTVSMEEIRRSSAALRAEMTRCSYAAYVLITQVSPLPVPSPHSSISTSGCGCCRRQRSNTLRIITTARQHHSPPLSLFSISILMSSRLSDSVARMPPANQCREAHLRGPGRPFFDSAVVLSQRPTLRPLSRAAPIPCPIRRSVLDVAGRSRSRFSSLVAL